MISTQKQWIERYLIDGERAVGRCSFGQKKFDLASSEAVDRLFKVMLDLNIKGGASLDLGCGVGRMSRVLKAFSFDVFGLDIVPYAIERAQEFMPAHTRGNFQVYDGQNIPFPDRCFDIVLSWTVLQHVPHVESTILAKEIERVLAEKGKLILFENVSNIEDKPHIWFRGSDGYERMFSGLRVIHHELYDDFKFEEGEKHALMVFEK